MLAKLPFVDFENFSIPAMLKSSERIKWTDVFENYLFLRVASRPATRDRGKGQG